MKLLITGFEPFGGEPVNPSWEAVKAMAAPAGAELCRLCLPVCFHAAGERLTEALESEKPDAVLCVGQAAGRAAVTPERFAVNLRDARIPDNAGAKPQDEAICADGPAAYGSTLPLRKLEAALLKAGLPAELSNSAGTFVCNELFYVLMHYVNQMARPIPAGFVHVPALPEQAARMKPGTPSLAQAEITRALELMAEAIVRDS